MRDRTNTYGDFTEPKEPRTSRRSEEVVIRAVERCEKLCDELFKCVKLLYTHPEHKEFCEENYPEFIEKLKGVK